MIAGTACRFAGERPWKRSGKCLILCVNSIGLARLPIGHKALITVGVAMVGANTHRRPPDELRLQAYHGLSSRITSLYWFNLSLRSLLAFPDLIEPMTRVGREIRMLEDYYLEGDAVSHERILRDGKPGGIWMSSPGHTVPSCSQLISTMNRMVRSVSSSLAHPASRTSASGFPLISILSTRSFAWMPTASATSRPP